MKKLLGIVAITLTLSACTTAEPAPKKAAQAYAVPADCEIKDLIVLDDSFQALDQTETGAKGVRSCVIGTPNSDVGIFFEFKETAQSTWDDEQLPKAKADGYTAFDAGINGVEVLRMQAGSEEEGASCSLQGFMGGISFTVMEPWAECDDQWNKELVGYVVNHAKVAN
ncbi:MAG: hypothetical protein RJA45_203 [Actinomycetota bacterium]